MYDPLGLSIGTTNLAAVRSGHPPVTRRAVLTLFPDRAPELGVPEESSVNPADTGTLMAGFVERIGVAKSLTSADGSTHDPALLLVEALEALITATGGEVSTSNITMAVPAHWGVEARRGLQEALGTHAGFFRNGGAPRIVSDSVAALTALNSDARLPSHGVVALFDFGGAGTSITLADAASGFTPIADTLRYAEFSGDGIDQALMVHVLDSAGHGMGADPSSTAVVGQFATLREECRLAKERLSAETATELVVELPGKRATVEVTRAELDGLIEHRLAGMLSAFDDMLRRSRVRRKDLAAVAMAGGGAKIPVVAQCLSSHSKTSVVTAVQPALAVAVGAVMLSSRHPVEQREEDIEVPTMAALVGASTGSLATSSGTFAAPTDSLGAPTGTFSIPTAGTRFDDPSETMHELAWSQADDSGNEPVIYTGEPYEVDVNHGTPSQLLQLPKFEPPDEPQHGNRLPQLFLGLAALVSMVAIGGVAYSLTSSTDRVPTLPTSTTAVPPPPLSSQLLSPSPMPSAPPPPTSEAPPPPPAPTSEAPPPPPTSEAPPPPPPPVTTTYRPPPPRTTTAQATTTPPQPTTTTPAATSTTPSSAPPPPPPSTPSTSPSVAMTTTYLNLPFVPVPIPVQVPEGQNGANQQPQNPYQQQNPYQNPYQQSPYQPQSPYMPQNPYSGPGYGY